MATVLEFHINRSGNEANEYCSVLKEALWNERVPYDEQHEHGYEVE